MTTAESMRQMNELETRQRKVRIALEMAERYTLEYWKIRFLEAENELLRFMLEDQDG